MPYWLMNFEEHCEVFLTTHGAERQRDARHPRQVPAAGARQEPAAEGISKLTVDSPIPYLLSDLDQRSRHEMGKLDKAATPRPIMRLKTKIDEIKADPRYSFMFSGMLVADTMADFIAKHLPPAGHGKPISIIDVSGVPSDITSVVVAVLARMVFDYAIWSRSEAQRPVLLVCEEAHRYVPTDKTGERPGGPQDPRADRQGRPQIRRRRSA